MSNEKFIYTDASGNGTWHYEPTGDGMKITNGGIAVDGTTPVAGRFTGAFTAGAGTESFTPTGIIEVNTTQAATAANTDATTLWSYSLPASTMNADGRAVRITVMGTFGANANAKITQLKFGSTNLTSYSNTGNNIAWSVTAVVIRTSATAQLAVGYQISHGLSVQSTLTTPAETLANAVTIAFIGQNGVASASDIVFRGALVEYL